MDLQQICHRDLKLENTLLDGSPAPRLKICDFGYSKVCSSSSVFSSSKSRRTFRQKVAAPFPALLALLCCSPENAPLPAYGTCPFSLALRDTLNLLEETIGGRRTHK